ncbi:unnamed protein product, partial [Hapterophycus canaliculatus]
FARIRRNKGRWTSEEHEAFLLGLRLFKRDNWAAVAAVVPTRTVLQVRTHAQKYFNKVDKGEEFPEEPYPSQYDAEAGKSGVAAGAYLYGVSHQNQQQLHQGEQDIQQHHHQQHQQQHQQHQQHHHNQQQQPQQQQQQQHHHHHNHQHE